jgi:cytochrome c oxidase assembly factor 3
MPAGIFNSTYYGKDYRAGAALLRARRPYLVKNALTGLGLFGFCVSVYVFTIRAVGQEDFSDVVVVPDAPAVPKKEQK